MKPLDDLSVDVKGWTVWGKKGVRYKVRDRVIGEDGDLHLTVEGLDRPIKVSAVAGYEVLSSKSNLPEEDLELFNWFMSWQVPEQPFPLKPGQLVKHPQIWLENVRKEVELWFRGVPSIRAKSGLLQADLRLLRKREEWMSCAIAVGLIIGSKLNSRNEFGVQFVSGDWAEIEAAMKMHPISELMEARDRQAKPAQNFAA